MFHIYLHSHDSSTNTISIDIAYSPVYLQIHGRRLNQLCSTNDNGIRYKAVIISSALMMAIGWFPFFIVLFLFSQIACYSSS